MSGHALFSIERRSYSWRDVVIAAMLRGDWLAVEQRLRRGLACVKGRADGREAPPSFDLDQAATDFRYRLNLITAEETEAWLDRSGVSMDDWTAYLERALLLNAWSGELAAIADQYPVEDEEIGRQVYAEAVCSGDLWSFAETLAARASIFARETPSTVEAPGSFDPVTARSVYQNAGAVLQHDEELEPADEELIERVDHLLHIERAFARFKDRVVTRDAVREQLEAHRIEWLRVSWRYVDFPDESIAREAALCVREEGMTLEDAASQAGVDIFEDQPLLERIDRPFRPHVLSAKSGQLVGPMPGEAGCRLAAIDRKVPPTTTDPEVSQRARDEVLRAAIAEHARHVHWHQFRN